MEQETLFSYEEDLSEKHATDSINRRKAKEALSTIVESEDEGNATGSVVQNPLGSLLRPNGSLMRPNGSVAAKNNLQFMTGSVA